MPETTVARPHTRPTSNFTISSNSIIEDLVETADTATAIQLFLLRNTIGWHKEWYVTTITALAKALDRSRTQVKTKLGHLVAEGRVIREDLGSGSYRLALAEPHSENSKHYATEKNGGKLAPETVDNFSKPPEHQFGGGRKTDQGGGRKTDQGVVGKPTTPPESNHCDHCGSPPPKQRQTESYNKNNRVLKPHSTPATTVENPLSKPVSTNVLDENSSSGSRRAKISERGCKIPGKPSLDDLIGDPRCEPVRVKRLRGFPDREEVPYWNRMDYEAFDALWDRCLTTTRGHTALKAYIWYSFTAAEAQYLILQCSRSDQNLYGYANRVVRSMMDGLSGPRRGSQG